MPPLRIDDLQFDSDNREHILRHGITESEVWQVFLNGFEILRNAKMHEAPYKMVGATDGGRFISIPIAPTGEPFVWRPATAMLADEDEKSKLKGLRR
jgi:hypothetical protein